jgi:HD-GYP domain-containing protein (c-di-GMP phosphodiesterase class II)
MPQDKTQTPLYNSRIVDTYVKLLQRAHPNVDVHELLRYAGMEPYEVADPGHWFTQEQVDLFHERLVQLTGNENISREAGRYAVSHETLGHLRYLGLSLLDPGSVFAIISQVTPLFTKSSDYRSRRLHASKVEITVTPRAGVAEKPFQCENRLGYFEAIVRMFNYELIQIEHPECFFRGGSCCRYIVHWRQPFFALWRKARNYTAVAMLSACGVLLFVKPMLTLATLLPVSVMIFLFLECMCLTRERQENRATIDFLKNSSDELLEQSRLNYNNALMASEIGETLTRQTRKQDLLDKVVEILRERMVYDRGMILLANQEGSRLEYKAGYGYSLEEYRVIRQSAFHLDKPGSRGLFVVSYREQKPFLVNDMDDIEEDLSERSLALAKKLNVRSFICCPIICERTSYGILAVDNVRSKRPMVKRDVNLLMGVAHFIGISLRNSDLIESKENQFQSLLRVLAASIDARDPLTAGHSDRVTDYALGICDELGLSEETRYVIQVAALLHDYGKIGVPDSILKKPAILTEEEFEVVRTHSRQTREILEQIDFEGELREVPHIAEAHHERLDGSGYPRGLSGEEIPLGGRIIAVADFFEAITSKRHYREPMPLQQAFELLFEKSGVHFDSRVVAAFYRYFRKSNNSAVFPEDSRDRTRKRLCVKKVC